MSGLEEQKAYDAKMAADTDIQAFKTTLIRAYVLLYNTSMASVSHLHVWSGRANMASSALAKATILLLRDLVVKRRWQTAK